MLAPVGDDALPQPYVCDDLDALVRLGADVYVGTGVSGQRHREAWWRKMREAGLETYHRHDDAPISTGLPVVHPWTAAVRLAASPATQVLGPHLSGRRLERSRARGVTSIVAGALGGRPPAYHPEQLVAAHHGDLWIVVVPAPGVDVIVGREQLVTGELHAGPALAVDLTLSAAASAVRAGRGSEAARDAGRWPPRHAVPVAPVARAGR